MNLLHQEYQSFKNGSHFLQKKWLLFLVFLLVSKPLLAAGEPEAAEGFWLLNFYGRLHPLLVHFPVSLLIIAFALEVIDWRKKTKTYANGVKALVYTGAATTALSVLAGLQLVTEGEYSGGLAEFHKWSGIACLAITLLTAWALWVQKTKWFRGLLIATVVSVIIAGHYGASLTHGEDFLTEVLPFGQEKPAEKRGDIAFVANSDGQPLNEQQVQELTLEVRTIFAHSCNNCHGEAKSKGGLRLDKKEFIMAGGEDGKVIVPGKPGDSELLRRISLPEGHKELMPTKGKHLSDKEIAIIEYWIKQGAPWPTGNEKSIYRIAEMAPRMPVIPAATAQATEPIDRFVNAYFTKKKISWKPVVDDRTYLRRVYLDVIGLLPPPEKVEAFTHDMRPDKRLIVVRELLNRKHDYAQHWLSFWNDLLRNDYTGTGYITGGRSDISKWLYTSLVNNKPYNTFISELISPTEESRGFIRGIEWRGTINASQRTEMQAAQNVSQIALGLNLKCASCHDSFISDWKLDDAYAFANIFAEKPLEINRCDKPTGKMASTRMLFKDLGEIDPKANTQKRLEMLARYLTQPKDGRLYRTLVNRVWAQVMGRGLVEPVDMMDNMPWDQDLLDYLASDFVANGSDIKRLLEKILTSNTYQLPSVGAKDLALLTRQDFVFEGMVRRRLTAEQFSDAVSSVFQPVYSDSAIVVKSLPEDIKKNIPFVRASIVKNDQFLTALGRPNRETVSTGRSSQASLLQALELSNGKLFNETLKKGSKAWKQKYAEPEQIVKLLYQKALNRNPLPKEMAIAQKVLGASPTEESIQDLVWAITLHPEFQLIF